jgi:hypothetical protein
MEKEFLDFIKKVSYMRESQLKYAKTHGYSELNEMKRSEAIVDKELSKIVKSSKKEVDKRQLTFC